MGGDAKLFLQFPHEGSFRCLAWLYLPPGELPQTRHGLAWRTLLEKDAAVGVHQRNRYNMKKRARIGDDICVHKTLLTPLSL